MRISLIHATPVAVQPVADAFEAGWPDAMVTNLLDDSLSPDLKATGSLTQEITDRFLSLGRYAAGTRADAILFTCSAFGPCIEAVASDLAPMPVLKPNEAMFEEALGMGSRIGMLATFQPSVPPMEDEFYDLVEKSGGAASLTTVCADGAMDALLAGDPDRHNTLVADAASDLDFCDVIMLAHFSTAKAQPAVSAAVDCPILTSPDSAVRKLKSNLT